MEKNKKERSAGIVLMGEGKKILETGKLIAGMIGQELIVLLKLFNKPNPTIRKVDEKRKRLKKY